MSLNSSLEHAKRYGYIAVFSCARDLQRMHAGCLNYRFEISLHTRLAGSVWCSGPTTQDLTGAITAQTCSDKAQ